MKPKPTLWIALALAVSIPAAALAGPGFGHPGDRAGDPGRHFLPPPGYLELTDDQIAAAEVIRDGLRDRLQALHEEHAARRQQLRDLLAGDDPDPAAVGGLVIELHGGRGRFREALTAADAEFSALLTPEQLVKWENFKELRGRRGPRGFGRGHGPGHGPGGGFGGPPADAPRSGSPGG